MNGTIGATLEVGSNLADVLLKVAVGAGVAFNAWQARRTGKQLTNNGGSSALDKLEARFDRLQADVKRLVDRYLPHEEDRP